MQYKIASFNVKNLSDSVSAEKLDNITQIIKDNNLDIVALQEVLSNGKILTGSNKKSISGQAKAYENSLKRRLGDDWSICWRSAHSWAKDYAYSDVRGEGYAFLWNTKRIELVEDNGVEILPRIFRKYDFPEDGMIRLIRDPCYGRFKIKGRRPEIRLISTHIVYSKPKNRNRSNEENELGSILRRKNEFQIIAGQIYPQIESDSKLNTVPYTIILGDYNLNLPNSIAGYPTVPEIACFDDKGRALTYHEGAPIIIETIQSELTTLKLKEDGLANNYDHFSYGRRVRNSNIIKAVDVINIMDRFTGAESKYEQYKKKVSDHLPIVLTIEI